MKGEWQCEEVGRKDGKDVEHRITFCISRYGCEGLINITRLRKCDHKHSNAAVPLASDAKRHGPDSFRVRIRLKMLIRHGACDQQLQSEFDSDDRRPLYN
eukprot:gene1932-12927_t